MRRVIVVLVLLVARCAVSQNLEEELDVDEEVTVEYEPEVEEASEYVSPMVGDAKSVYLWEPFDDADSFARRWVRSAAAGYDGEWSVEGPARDAVAGDTALVLKSKARHAAIAAPLARPFTFGRSRPLVVQYEVMFQDGQECGGAYVKLLEASGDGKLEQFRDSTPYTVMFGPDKCGNEHKLHFIFRHVSPVNGTAVEKHLAREKQPAERLDEQFRDRRPHLYRLVMRPSGQFEVLVDGARSVHGSLLEDFAPPVNPPEEVDDPEDARPPHWDDRERVPDPGAVKPPDWDEEAPPQVPDTLASKPEGWLEDEPATVPDPEAARPADWDDEMDGEWEAPRVDNPACAGAAGCGPWSPPLVPNPAYRGKWRAPLVENPNYRGVWRPRRIPNPQYYRDERPFEHLRPIAAVGFELWSMSRDMLFDNVLVTDSEQEAEELARRTWYIKKRRAEKDAEGWWGRAMRATNHHPGWWAVYAVWCLTPIALYWRHVWARGTCKESLVTRLVGYAEERPWLWAVYLLGVGLPVALLAYCCCCRSGTSSASTEDLLMQDQQGDAADYKKTDELTVDDVLQGAADEGELPQEAEQDEDVDVDDQDQEPEPGDMEQPAAGDAPVRRRAVRKE